MTERHSLSVVLEQGKKIYPGNNRIQLVVHNASSIDYQEAVIWVESAAGITVQPSRLVLSPLLANSPGQVPILLYAAKPGVYRISLHVNTFPAPPPEEGFLDTRLQINVVPRPETASSSLTRSVSDEIEIFPAEKDNMNRLSKLKLAGSGDVYSLYEVGLNVLLARIKQEHSRYSDVLVYEQRLKENIAQSRRFGDTETRRAERTEIIEHLNELTLSVLATTFRELCFDSESK